MDLLTAALAVAALSAPGLVQGRPHVLRSVQILAAVGAAKVVIEADGPLPQPIVGVLDDPPRIFLDFPGVAVAREGTVARGAGLLVRRVRVGLRPEQGVCTRVVLDLTELAPYELDPSASVKGRLVVLLHQDDAAKLSGAASAGDARATRTRSGAERGGATLEQALADLERLRPVLSGIDRREDLSETRLREAIDEFGRTRELLAGAHAVGRLEAIQQGLMKVCTLGVTASGGRLEAQQRADAGVAWNAASAAAGALILLDRAASQLRSPVLPR